MAARRLFLVKVTHTLEEMGILKDQIAQKFLDAGGEEELKKFVELTNMFWFSVDKIMENLNLYRPENASRLHIFSDGLPDPATAIPPEKDNGRAVKVILELAREGIPQSKIIEKMLTQGAHLHGTEDHLWFAAHCRYYKDTILENKDLSPQLETLLRGGRDKAIARRINEVVPEGEDGILFIGADHGVHIMMNLLGFDQNMEIIDVLKPPGNVN